MVFRRFIIIIFLTLSFHSSLNAQSLAEVQRLLFVGNSFTQANQLDQLVAQLLAVQLESDQVAALAVAPGGYQLSHHFQDFQSAESANPLRSLLTGPERINLVVLQGQSQIAGFSDSQEEKKLLIEAVTGFQSHIQKAGAQTMLYMTWGYADGDPSNPDFYPDFMTMQEKLSEGYYGLASKMSPVTKNVLVAPVGLGFQKVFQEEKSKGLNPLAQDALFRSLYASDGRHPSLAGSYLAAAIIVASYSGQRVAPVDWQPEGLDRPTANYLRFVADRVMFR